MEQGKWTDGDDAPVMVGGAPLDVADLVGNIVEAACFELVHHFEPEFGAFARCQPATRPLYLLGASAKKAVFPILNASADVK